MKKLFAFLCMFLSVLALYARAIHEDYKKAEEKARVSYAFGMDIGNYLSRVGIDFDYEAFKEGVRAVLEENLTPQFSDQEAVEIIETAWQEAMEKKSAQNRRLEEEFLARNGARPEVIVTPSGLQYEILVETAGEKPNPDSIVKVHYIGTFSDGSPFDSSTEEEGAYIPLDMVISGWTEGLLLMSVGSNYRLYIPSYLAYGKEGIQQIVPPYSTLIFTVELLEILGPNSFDFGGPDSIDFNEDFEPERPANP